MWGSALEASTQKVEKIPCVHSFFAALSLTATAASVAFAGTSVLVHDRFESSTPSRYDDQNDPLDIGYHTYDSSTALGVGYADANHYLQVVPVAPNSRFASTSFQRTSLAVGDSLTLSFSLQNVHGSGAWQSAFSIGLYDSMGTAALNDNSLQSSLDDQGYGVTLADGSSTGINSSFARDDAPSYSPDVNYSFGQAHFGDGQWHNYQLTLERNIHSMLVTISEDGVVLFNQHVFEPLFTSFDNIHFMPYQTGQTFRLDDIYVALGSTAVPEPASLAGLSLGAILMLARRKR